MSKVRKVIRIRFKRAYIVRDLILVQKRFYVVRQRLFADQALNFSLLDKDKQISEQSLEIRGLSLQKSLAYI